jgi:hypothetical protein
MATATAEFTKEEIVQRGKEIYDRDIKSKVEPHERGRIVAIDVRTGEYELADDEIASSALLRGRLPEAVIFFVRVGFPGLRRILSFRLQEK